MYVIISWVTVHSYKDMKLNLYLVLWTIGTVDLPKKFQRLESGTVEFFFLLQPTEALSFLTLFLQCGQFTRPPHLLKNSKLDILRLTSPKRFG